MKHPSSRGGPSPNQLALIAVAGLAIVALSQCKRSEKSHETDVCEGLSDVRCYEERIYEQRRREMYEDLERKDLLP